METKEIIERKTEIQHKFVEIDGVRTHYVEAGEGKPLVLVDGWYSNWDTFQDSIPAFAKNRRVIAIDLWGFGESEELPQENSVQNYAQFLNKFLENLGIEKTSIVGVSLGGSVALEFATRFGQKIEKLVVQGAPIHGRELLLGLKPPSSLTKRFWSKFVKPVVQNPWLSLLYLRINPEKRKLSRDELLKVAKTLPNASQRAAVEGLQSIFELDLRERCKALQVSTLILEGTQVFWPPLATGKKLHQLIPNSKLVIISGAAHEIPTQRPTDFTAEIVSFLKD